MTAVWRRKIGWWKLKGSNSRARDDETNSKASNNQHNIIRSEKNQALTANTKQRINLHPTSSEDPFAPASAPVANHDPRSPCMITASPLTTKPPDYSKCQQHQGLNTLLRWNSR